MAKRRRNDVLVSGANASVVVNKRKTPHEEESITERDASKEERREHKRLKKLKKLDKENDTPRDSNNPSDKSSGSATPEAEKLAANLARKAEKKRLDAAKNGAARAARKAEKRLMKAEKKEKRSSHKSAVTGQDLSKSKDTTLPVRRTSNETQISCEYIEDSTLSALPQSEIDRFLSSNFITITDPRTSSALRPIISFSQLPSSAHPKPSPFAKFKSPTPIQSASWPFLLSGRDVIGVAETGSGKTLAFGVPCVRYIASLPVKSTGGAARAVIVSPTRELAVQIHEQLDPLAKQAGFETVCVYGGVPKESQRLSLKTARIIVATPGRLNDLVEEESADLSNVGYVVLDEADRMLDKGFEEAIRQIIQSCANKTSRQTLMFTATWPQSVRELASTFMQTPVKIAIGDNPTGELRANTKIEQRVEVVEPRSKEFRLLQLIKQYQSGKSKNDRILVFCLYKKEATRVELSLRSKGLRVAGIHGDLSQEKRSASLESFKNGTTPLLVATDVAARGLDIPAVKVVINVTFPLTVEDYVHRIGRYVHLDS